MKYFVVLLVLIGLVGTALAESPVDKDLTAIAELWCSGNRSEGSLIDFLGNFSYIDPEFHDTFFQEKFAEELLMRTPELMVYGSDDAFFITQKGDATQNCPPVISFEGSFSAKDGKRYDFTIWHDSAKTYDYEINNLVFPNPKYQLKAGINPTKIACKDELQLIQKHDGSPACVKSTTKQHLMDRGWAEQVSFDKIKSNPELMKQNIIRMEDGRISLYPENTCASITLDLPTEKEIQRYKHDEKGLNESNTLQITSSDFNEIPIIEELIYAVNTIEFPYNKYLSAYLDGLTFVEYEFFLMEKAIEKYDGSQKDYFIKLDNDYKERFANPAKQGFTNTFEAPLIVYNNQTYSVGGTMFWVSDEHEPMRMNVYPDEIKEDEKFIVLTDEDMKSVPKIKQAIEDIGTIQESINGRKGLPEDQWNEYREWFKQKSQEQLNADRFRLIQHDEQFYSVGFGIC
jgi:hypothetical protein